MSSEQLAEGDGATPPPTPLTTTGGATTGTEPASGFLHKIKRMPFLNREVSVVLQNENGPCPLLALVNVLLLRGTLDMHADRSDITSEALIAMVGNLIMEKNPAADGDADMQRTLNDVISMLPSLQFGLDVNVRFSGIADFEYDSRIAVFDLLGVNLFHGWVVSSDDEEAHAVLGDRSYNQTMDLLISCQELEAADGGSSADLVKMLRAGEVASKFLEDTASQFTFAGLTGLHDAAKERELSAFFRNNHFSTMFKLDGALYLLITDMGYRHNNAVAWELLNDIGGDTDLRSPSFGDPNEFVHPNDLGQKLSGQRRTTKEGGELDADEVLARQLQEDERANINLASASVAQVEAARRRLQARERRAGGKKSGGNCAVM